MFSLKSNLSKRERRYYEKLKVLCDKGSEYHIDFYSRQGLYVRVIVVYEVLRGPLGLRKRLATVEPTFERAYRDLKYQFKRYTHMKQEAMR